MGLTPSAAPAADLQGMLTPACTMTLRSSKRALWIFLLCAAFCAFNATAMDGNNAAPGHAWTPGRHIIAMPESGHPAIMDGTFGAPYWRALRPRMIQFLVANYLWDRLLDAGAAVPAADGGPHTISIVDGHGGRSNLPAPPVDAPDEPA